MSPSRAAVAGATAIAERSLRPPMSEGSVRSVRKNHELIDSPQNAKAEVVVPISAGDPQARARPEELDSADPAAAAQHTPAAVTRPATIRPLPHVPNNVRQARPVGAIRADRTRPCVSRSPPAAPALRSSTRPLFPLRLARQPIRRARGPTQQGHVFLRVLPTHACDRMIFCLPKTGVPPSCIPSFAGIRSRRRFR